MYNLSSLEFHCPCWDVNVAWGAGTDSKFSSRVLVRMTPKNTTINWVTIWLEQLEFCLHRSKWELSDQPTAFCHLNCFFNIHVISTVCSHDMCQATKLLHKAKFLISYRDSCWVPTLRLLRSDQLTYCFRCDVYNVMRPTYAWHTSKSVWWKSSYHGCM